jgi:hypothetical protein
MGIRIVRYIAAYMMGCVVATSVLADETQQRVEKGAGYLIPQSKVIFVGEVKSVAWDGEAKGAGKVGRAVFVIRQGIRGITTGGQIELPVQELSVAAAIHGGNYMWQGAHWDVGSVWLIVGGAEKGGVLSLSQVKGIDDPIVRDVAKASEIDSKKTDDKLKALEEVLGGKSLKPVLLVNYGIEAAGSLVRTQSQACSILLSVASESTNPASIRTAAMDAISRNLADGRQKDERATWAEEVQLLLETAPKMNQYSSVLSRAIHMGSWEKVVVVPSDVKLKSPEKVKDALRSVTAKLDESIPALKEKLAAAKSPATTFPAEYQREQRIAELQSSIQDTEKLSAFLRTLATSATSQPTTLPAGDGK